MQLHSPARWRHCHRQPPARSSTRPQMTIRRLHPPSASSPHVGATPPPTSSVSTHPPHHRKLFYTSQPSPNVSSSQPTAPLSHYDVALVTQVSLDRWPRFAATALAWGGPVSVAVYIPCSPHHPLATQYEGYLSRLAYQLEAQMRLRGSGSGGCGDAAGGNGDGGRSGSELARWRGEGQGQGLGGEARPGRKGVPLLTVSVLYAREGLAPEGAAVLPEAESLLREQQEQQQPQQQLREQQQDAAQRGHGGAHHGEPSEPRPRYGTYDKLYPINALRNAALERAPTSHVWLVDGDFVPSAGLYDTLVGGRRLPRADGDTGARGRGLEEQRPDGSAPHATAAAADDGGGVGAGDTGGLLAAADDYPRPVMWVVPAFELRRGAPRAVGGGTAAGTGVAGGAGASLVRSGLDTAGARRSSAESGTGKGAAAGAGGAVGGGDASVIADDEHVWVPRTVEELAACAGRAVPYGELGAGGGQLADCVYGVRQQQVPGEDWELVPFHCGRYPQPVSSIDYEEWWQRSLAGRHGRRGADACSEVAGGGLGSAGGMGGAAGSVIPQAGGTARAGCHGSGGGSSRDSSSSVAQRGCGVEQGANQDEGGNGSWYVVPYHEFFEPYGVAPKDQVPRYDERFAGYGLNKVQHAYHAAAMGYEFRLLTGHFCVTLPHARSSSYRAVFGTSADPAQRQRIEALYDTFKEEMRQQYGYQYGSI